MKTYGRKPIRDNLEDRHPQKGYVNWWEAEFDMVSKKGERQRAKKEIEKEIKNESPVSSVGRAPDS